MSASSRPAASLAARSLAARRRRRARTVPSWAWGHFVARVRNMGRLGRPCLAARPVAVGVAGGLIWARRVSPGRYLVLCPFYGRRLSARGWRAVSSYLAAFIYSLRPF